MIEGKPAWQEAIDFIENRVHEPLPALKWEPGVSRAAQDHVEDQGKTSELGHISTDGRTNPDKRVSRYGRRAATGENLYYGRHRGGLIYMLGLFIDEGVPNRGHRTNILNKHWDGTGIYQGAHA